MGKRLRLRKLRLGGLLLLLMLALTTSAPREQKRLLELPQPSRNTLWPIQVGIRMRILRSKIPTVDRVVLVPDQATFLLAIQSWSLRGRFPILIEDQQYTPMFIKRFRPAEVIRIPTAIALAGDHRSHRQKQMLNAVAAAWNLKDSQDLPTLWQRLGWLPPGVVLTTVDDPAASAAVALAAAWGQPLGFLEGDFGMPNDRLEYKQWQHLQAEVEQAVAQTGYPYKALGDAIDTVTIARQLAVKYKPSSSAQEDFAVTDGLARNTNEGRWAIAGWIYGSASRSVYQAMCSIFLDQETVLLYDSYPKEGAWLNYAMQQAAQELEQVGLVTTLLQQPDVGLQQWRNLTKGGIDFDLIFVNSQGGKRNFGVGNGSASVKDIPELHIPAAIHFIHSWSSVTPDDTNTVAGRWLANGAYAYVGSVNEPYLSAFVPPATLVRRLLPSAPFLIAARQLQSRPWKVTTIGDPLMLISPPRQRLSPRDLPWKLQEANN